MPAFIHHIATRVPDTAYTQKFARDFLKDCAPDPKTKRLIQIVYDRSGIATRYSVVDDFTEGADPVLFKRNAEGEMIPPTTGERNKVYAKASRELSVALARQVLEEAEGFVNTDVTHVIFASCTGFANPGPDYHIIRELGLNPGVERYTLGFMGCYAAFPALRMAAQFCEANPHAVVLVMCLELCTLHMQINGQTDSILANSLFADGAAAAIVSARAPVAGTPAYRVEGFSSALLPSGENDMAWEIGDEGFNIVLSSYVPGIIGSNIESLLEGVLGESALGVPDVEEWAVHPGGRSILDKVETSLALSSSALASSRNVLRDYGNMSSATVLFVLKDLLERAESETATTCAIAFGPGLTVETAVLERIGGPVPLSRDTQKTSLRFESVAAEPSLV
ncbi:MAG: type III polyketide synthase [Verrucomicrobia bacterium]|nr:type III polyketide synthase [Verrucomicrobiota bacterium]